jgi:O-antigen/teichoic acid export membrane protein
MNLSHLQKHRHIVDGTIWVFLAEALLMPTGVIITVFLTRRLGPEGYGLFTLVAVLVAWVESSITSIFDRTTVKFVGQAEDWRPVGAAVARLYLAASGGAMLLLWLLANPIATLLNEPVLATYLRLFALDIPLFSLAHAHRNILVGLGGFRQRALVSAGRWLTRLLLIVLRVSGRTGHWPPPCPSLAVLPLQLSCPAIVGLRSAAVFVCVEPTLL